MRIREQLLREAEAAVEKMGIGKEHINRIAELMMMGAAIVTDELTSAPVEPKRELVCHSDADL